MSDLYATAQQYLLEHNVLCLATCVENIPWVAPVFYTVYSGKLVFLSATHTLHCKNLAKNPVVSASIQEDYSDWKDIKGFQIQGGVQAIASADVSAVVSAYSAKFPVTGENAPVEIAKALDRIQWFELSITKLYFIDNSKGLGNRDTLDPTLLLSN